MMRRKDADVEYEGETDDEEFPLYARIRWAADVSDESIEEVCAWVRETMQESR